MDFKTNGEERARAGFVNSSFDREMCVVAEGIRGQARGLGLSEISHGQ